MTVMVRTAAEVAAAWTTPDELHAEMPENPRMAGVRRR